MWATSLGSSIGSGLSALCCLGTPVIIGILSAVGLGFMINDAVLLPLLTFFLGLNLWATYQSTKRHGRKEDFLISAISASLIISGLWFSGVVVGFGILGVFIASGLSFYFSKTSQLNC